MDNEIKKCIIPVVQRFRSGESPESICASMNKSKFWLYKWVKRHNEKDPLWFKYLYDIELSESSIFYRYLSTDSAEEA